jgi:hypothetical protein
MASVSVEGTLTELTEQRTKLVSEQVFAFKGCFNSVLGFLAAAAIRTAHRHMEAFKRFVEDRAAQQRDPADDPRAARSARG